MTGQEYHDTVCRLREINANLLAACEAVVAAEERNCRTCEGNGRMYADGRAHYPSENAPTIACGHCGGSGHVAADFEALREIARSAIAAADRRIGV